MKKTKGFSRTESVAINVETSNRFILTINKPEVLESHLKLGNCVQTDKTHDLTD